MMCNTEIRDICNNVNNKASTIIKLSSHVINYPLHKYFFCSTSPARNPHRRISIDSTLEADSCDLASVTVLPTDEKSCSDCAELADMANTLRATVDRMGYCLAWFFQN